jgi:hypothetical protein
MPHPMLGILDHPGQKLLHQAFHFFLMHPAPERNSLAWCSVVKMSAYSQKIFEVVRDPRHRFLFRFSRIRSSIPLVYFPLKSTEARSYLAEIIVLIAGPLDAPCRISRGLPCWWLDRKSAINR